GGDRGVLAQRQREDHEVRALGRLTGGDRLSARGQELGDQRDLRGVAGAGDQHLMTGGDREAGQDRADLPGAEDPEREARGAAHGGPNAPVSAVIPEGDGSRAAGAGQGGRGVQRGLGDGYWRWAYLYAYIG